MIDWLPVQVLYMPSGQVARKLAISPRTLGKITGNLYVQLGDGTKEDIGLFVKHGSKGLCVPDYVQAKPEDKGWAYSQALLQVLDQYKVGRPPLSCQVLFLCSQVKISRLQILPPVSEPHIRKRLEVFVRSVISGA